MQIQVTKTFLKISFSYKTQHSQKADINAPWYSNTQSKQASGCRTTPYNARQKRPAFLPFSHI